MRIPEVLALVLAGGKGSRLGCLTAHRPKPVLPVGGTYRMIDIPLSNLAHSHISRVGIVEEYLPNELNAYLAGGRPWDLDRLHGGLQVLPPFSGGDGEGFADGNADSIHNQRDFIRAVDPDYVLVLSADHLYTINYLDVLTTHLDARADLTIVTTEVTENPTRYGVVQAEESGRVTRFDYKPDEPQGKLVATEVFLYGTEALLEALDTLAATEGLQDYGHQLLPWFVENKTVWEHRHSGYWLDLGTVQSFWTANLQLLDGDGAALDDRRWPIWSSQPQLMPGRVTAGASVNDSLVGPGADIAGEVHHSVVGIGVTVEAGAVVRDCVLLDGVRVGSGVRLTNCVVDVGAHLSGTIVRGSEGVITLIDSDGTIDQRAPFDHSAVLPRGFVRAD